MADRTEEFLTVIFLISNGVLDSFEVSELTAARESLDIKIAARRASMADLAMGMSRELSLVMQSKRVVPGDEDCDHDTRVAYTFLCRRIFNLLQCLHQRYSVDEGMLGHILMFFSSNVTFLDKDNLTLFTEVVTKSKGNENHWTRLIKIYADMRAFDKMLDIIKAIVKTSNPFVLPLWNKIINYIKMYSPTMVINTYKAASQLTSGNVAEEIRYQYFKWFTLNNSDIILIRELFEDLKDLEPHSLRLYKVMINIESSRRNSRTIAIRQLFKESCQKFGKNNVDIWAEYIRFELKSKNPSLAKKLMTESFAYVNEEHKEAMLDVVKKIN